MKRFIFTLIYVLLVQVSAYSQTVFAPEPKSFTQSTNGQDASGFVLSGFNTTATLLASISLVNPPAGTTFYLDRLDGLTPASGFTLTGNKTRLVFTGTMANINIVLANLKVNTGATKGNIQISIAATVNPVGFFYNGVNGHFYRPLTATADRTTYTNARSRSLATSFKGQQGYLVTITSTSEEEFIRVNVPATNVWFAATDEVVDGRWVIDAGPEKGTVMKTQNGQLSGNIQGVYNNWCGGEPNGFNGSENYAVAKWNGAACWNDLSNNWNNPYVIEYGTWTNPDDATFTEFFTNSVTHSNGDVLRAQFNFEFGSSIDRARFTTKLLVQSNNQYLPTTNITRNLNGLGKVDMTSDLDTVKIDNSYKIHGVELNTVNMATLYNSIVTVSDVFLAFKELSNIGLLGNESGLEFGSGIQFMNADVDENGFFDERDSYILLQHLTGTNIIQNGSNNISDYIKILPKSEYDLVTKLNWNIKSNLTTNVFSPINLSTTSLLNSFTYSVFWKGDVNLSHSASQTSSNRISGNTSNIEAEIWSEVVGSTVVVELIVNPMFNNLSGIQFILNYDNSILQFDSTEYSTSGSPTNFSNDRKNFVSVGSITNTGQSLSGASKYLVKFKSSKPLKNSLGLVSVGTTDAISTEGKQLNVVLK